VSRLPVSLLLLLSLVGAGQATSSPRSLGPEDYAVYAAVLTNAHGRDLPTKPLRYIVLDTTDTASSRALPFAEADVPDWSHVLRGNSRDEHRQAITEAVHDFIQIRDIASRLEPSPAWTFDYALVSRDSLTAYFAPLHDGPGDGWEAFRERSGANPPSYFTLSRIGFTPKRDHAFLYVSYCCGGLCGRGFYCFLSKREGVWQIDGSPGPQCIS
jgi:hypothetical protein